MASRRPGLGEWQYAQRTLGIVGNADAFAVPGVSSALVRRRARLD